MAAPGGDAGGAATGELGVDSVVDGLPLIEAARKAKDEGNACVKRKQYNEAVKMYESGIATLDLADGKPMLRQEVEEMVALKATLYSNTAQCLLSLELFRRASEAATSCLALDEGNAKALHRRSLAKEALRDLKGALEDAVALQGLGGGPEDLEGRVAALRAKVEAEAKAAADEAAAESSEDECDTALVRAKQRFDEVVQKYDLQDGDAATQIADWLVSGEWEVTPDRVAKRWQMEPEDAEDLVRWIAKGLEFKAQNSSNQAQAAAQSPSLGIA
ncbi:unnamed protein product [Prorocentrum cordatum]|uniref:Uncharacterized protein n=1 Tax=Prorocentrum cordatum TaxID=2364126 RepID=A0ABN9PW81_9DINO|nr:unnamed protein product [Polarella glacialis]|mmetsp:Transcript_55192/g.148860  ORF Transcript_55192/g.148860 Transcript_55192/m.148860 type:complete len:274 (-) Transcript_55192:131-952(-)